MWDTLRIQPLSRAPRSSSADAIWRSCAAAVACSTLPGSRSAWPNSADAYRAAATVGGAIVCSRRAAGIAYERLLAWTLGENRRQRAEAECTPPPRYGLQGGPTLPLTHLLLQPRQPRLALRCLRAAPPRQLLPLRQQLLAALRQAALGFGVGGGQPGSEWPGLGNRDALLVLLGLRAG